MLNKEKGMEPLYASIFISLEYPLLTSTQV